MKSLKGTVLAGLIALGSASCATSVQSKPAVSESKHSIAPMEQQDTGRPELTHIEEIAIPDGMSAGGMLEYAMGQFDQKKYGRAGAYFRAAINTNKLNDAGRTLSYWHVAVCQDELGNRDNMNEAFSSFLTVGEDVLSVRESRRYVEDEGGNDFVTRFDLTGKISYARGAMNAAWVSKTEYFGRSPENPIIVRNQDELPSFFKFLDICESFYTDRQKIDGSLEKLLVNCDDGSPVVEFYMDFVE